MRHGIVLLLFFVFGISSVSAQVMPSPSSLQSSAAPSSIQSLVIMQPTGSPSLELAPVRAPLLPASARTNSLARHMVWGTLLGASAGLLSSLAILSTCEELCEDNRAAGVALHVSVGAVGGAGVGAILYWLRR